MLSWQPYYHHHVVITGLSTGTQYFYQCGDATNGYSEVYSFTTAVNAKVTAFNVVRVLASRCPVVSF
jgi:phosphodiesterase/alkaline phosphatase D-like protein